MQQRALFLFGFVLPKNCRVITTLVSGFKLGTEMFSVFSEQNLVVINVLYKKKRTRESSADTAQKEKRKPDTFMCDPRDAEYTEIAKRVTSLE